MTTTKSTPPSQDDPPESTRNYSFFVKAICVNLCFMTALTLLIITIGIIFSLVSFSGHGAGTFPITQSGAQRPVPVVTESRSVSVQHFEHIVQNGNQMAKQIRYLVPEAQQMFNDAVRIFYEAFFKMNSILVPEVPQDLDIQPVEAITEVVDTGNREKRDLQSTFLLSQAPKAEQQTCAKPMSNLEVLRKIFGPGPQIRDKRQADEVIFDPIDLDPLALEIWDVQNGLLEDAYDDGDEELREKIRRKRRAEMKVRQLKEKYARCRKMAQPTEKCNDIYKEVLHIMKTLNVNSQSIHDLMHSGGQKVAGEAKEVNAPKEQFVHTPMENNFDSHFRDDSLAPRVGFHEDMGRPSSFEPRQQWIDTTKFINQLTNQKIHNNAPSQTFNTNSATQLIVNRNENTAKPNSQQGVQQKVAGNDQGAAQSEFVAASGPFLSLCEKYARQGSPNFNQNQQNGQSGGNQNTNTFNGNTIPQQNNFNGQNNPSFIGITSWSPQFSNRGQNAASGSVIMTGESMPQPNTKVIFSPGFTGVSQNPVCFTAVPVQQRVNGNIAFVNVNGNQNRPVLPPKRHCKLGKCSSDVVFPTMIGTEESNKKDDEPNSFGIEPRTFSKGNGITYVAIPSSVGGGVSNNQVFRNQMFTGQGVNFPVFKSADTSNAMSFCTFSPVNSMALPVHYVTTQLRSGDDGENMLGDTKKTDLLRHMPTSSDIIYATYARNIMERANLTIHDHCKRNEISCFTGSQCISDDRWCDNIVDCLDASDESACSCKSRLAPNRICDGYPDCPMGNDELGCFGCDAFSYSCYRTQKEFETGRPNQCYTPKDRCDGFSVCFNGADERACSMLVRNLGQQLSFQVSYLDGYLYHNYQGTWYPVCQRPRAWATEACDDENGSVNEKPVISHRIGTIPGLFIQPANDGGEPKFTDNCDDKIVHVKCREPRCGRNVEPLIPTIRMKGERILDTDTDERVVGGLESEPNSWPYIVAIFKDGDLHCGATIYNEFWVIVAAHCFNQFEEHYYEVRAGMLRRKSFAPMTQIVKLSHVFPHPSYERKTMLNDIAMARVDTAFNFNRWVRPICLPSPERCGMAENWKMGPRVGTICTAIGWGALYEKGPGPDHLHEVSVPIIERCKTVLDNIGGSICAGEPQGGRDACQGDSGGPFLCRSERDRSEWYLAGIISHGDGCARADEPGVYTRVSLYLEWIETVIHGPLKEESQPRQLCPGYMCMWGGERCIPAKRRCDGKIHCLGGEDEVNCVFEESVGAPEGNFSSSTVEPQMDEKGPTTVVSFQENLIEEDDPVLPDVLENMPHVAPPSQTISPQTTTTTTTTTPTPTSTTERVAPIDAPKIIDEQTDTEPDPTEPSIVQTTVVSQTTTNDGPSKVNFDWTPPDETTTTESQVVTTQKDTEQTTRPVSTDPNGETRGDFAPKPFQSLTMFECKKLSQLINMKHRCDKFKDCQDGTDEEGCTCRDYLASNKTSLICNGHVDCADKSDEENCLTCAPGEYQCKVSRQCIRGDLRCNQVMDCTFGEDELDCYALTNGHTVSLGADNRPELNIKGFVTQNTRGVWSVLCDDQVFDRLGDELAGNVCTILEFKGYQFFNKTILKTSTLDVQRRIRQSLKHVRDQYERDQLRMRESPIQIEPERGTDRDFEPIVGNGKEECRALFVECVPFALTQHEEGLNQEDQTKIIDLLPVIQPSKKPVVLIEPPEVITDQTVSIRFPWIAEIFVNGKMRGIGILLDQYWVLTTSYCLESFDPYRDYMTVLLGKSTTQTVAAGPNEQVSRIDCIQHIPNSKVVLLHLETPCKYSRAVLPTLITQLRLETSIFIVLRNHQNQLIRFPANHLIDCDTHAECYFTGSMREINSIISNRDHNQIAMIVGYGKGYDESEGWYPKAFHKFDNGTMDKFTESVPLLQYHKTISSIIGYPYCQHSVRAAICMNGFRCPLGECLDRNVICNGIHECRDGSDEKHENCESRFKACPLDHFQCASGRCVPKVNFCDGIDHCGDKSDEPQLCSCFTYLQATEPQRICDGICNCPDKSDEDPRYCRCNQHNVPCGNSGVCVARSTFCDGTNDCPNGEDELHCYGIHYHTQMSRESGGYGEVMKQTYGLWHTKCYNKSEKPTQDEMIQLCQIMGYESDPKVDIRIINEDIDGDRPQALKPVLSSAFSYLSLNKNFSPLIKPSQPLVELVHWDEEDKRNCHRIEIRCAGERSLDMADQSEV